MKEKFNAHSNKKIPKEKKRPSDTSKNDSNYLGKGQVYKNNLLNVDTTSGYGQSRRII